MESKWDWIGVVLIAITIFEFWRNLRDDKKHGVNFSWSDLSPSNLFDGEGIGCLIVLIFAGLLLLFQESVEARILLVSGIAIYCGIRYFKSGLKEKPQKKMNFFEKIVEFICLVLLSLMVGFAIFTVAVPDMERYERKQMVKEIQQQQTQKSKPATSQYQR